MKEIKTTKTLAFVVSLEEYQQLIDSGVKDWGAACLLQNARRELSRRRLQKVARKTGVML